MQTNNSAGNGPWSSTLSFELLAPTATAAATETSAPPPVTDTPIATDTPMATPTATNTIPPTPEPVAFTRMDFTYDGNGARVKSVLNTDAVTTYFVGTHYEVEVTGTSTQVNKYYYAGSQRIAMRTCTDGTCSAPVYLLSDHLGSTSLTVDAGGNVLSELRYKAWGEVRYAGGTTPTKYSYTGQYSDSYINLLDYGSRHYDPELGRFTSPDSIVPLASQGVQAWDRYAYTNNNPVNYTDPSGHCIGPLLVACFAVATFIVDNAALITTVAVVGAVTSFTTADNPRPELMNDPAASQAEFENSLFVSTAWLTAGQSALEFGYAFPQAKMVEGADDEFSGLVYRGGGRTPSNFTPRPDKDVEQALIEGNTPGLSTYISPQNLQQYGQAKPGSAYQVLDTSQLQSPLTAVLDDAVTGHVTITTDLNLLREWSSTRPQLTPETSFDAAHVFTQMLNNIWTALGRIPK